MSAGAIDGEQIRALAGDRVPGIAVLVAGPEGVQAAGAAGLADVAGQAPASAPRPENPNGPGGQPGRHGVAHLTNVTGLAAGLPLPTTGLALGSGAYSFTASRRRRGPRAGRAPGQRTTLNRQPQSRSPGGSERPHAAEDDGFAATR